MKNVILALIIGIFVSGCAITSSDGRVTTTVGVGVVIGPDCVYYSPYYGCSNVYVGPGYILVTPEFRYRYYHGYYGYHPYSRWDGDHDHHGWDHGSHENHSYPGHDRGGRAPYPHRPVR